MSLLSFRSVCINVLLNSGIGAEFFMTCTFGIGMLYSDISLFTYVQIVVYFLNAAFQFYTSKVIWLCAGALALTLGGGGPKLECYGTVATECRWHSVNNRVTIRPLFGGQVLFFGKK